MITPLAPPPQSHPQVPVRDAARETVHEDQARQNDGVPHSVVGATAGFAVMLAVLVAGMFVAGHGYMRFAGIALVVIAVPFIVSGLRRKAERDRDHVHPSR